MIKKNPKKLVDSRYIKIIASKRVELKDSITLIYLDQDKFGKMDKSEVKSFIQAIDKLEPTGSYFPMYKKMRLEIYDRQDFKNRDILITINHDNDDIDKDEVESSIKKSIPEAKSINFIHANVNIDI